MRETGVVRPSSGAYTYAIKADRDGARLGFFVTDTIENCPLYEGDRVTFVRELGDDGRPRATEIDLVIP